MLDSGTSSSSEGSGSSSSGSGSGSGSGSSSSGGFPSYSGIDSNFSSTDLQSGAAKKKKKKDKDEEGGTKKGESEGDGGGKDTEKGKGKDTGNPKGKKGGLAGGKLGAAKGVLDNSGATTDGDGPSPGAKAGLMGAKGKGGKLLGGGKGALTAKGGGKLGSGKSNGKNNKGSNSSSSEEEEEEEYDEDIEEEDDGMMMGLAAFGLLVLVIGILVGGYCVIKHMNKEDPDLTAKEKAEPDPTPDTPNQNPAGNLTEGKPGALVYKPQPKLVEPFKPPTVAPKTDLPEDILGFLKKPITEKGGFVDNILNKLLKKDTFGLKDLVKPEDKAKKESVLKSWARSKKGAEECENDLELAQALQKIQGYPTDKAANREFAGVDFSRAENVGEGEDWEELMQGEKTARLGSVHHIFSSLHFHFQDYFSDSLSQLGESLNKIVTALTSVTHEKWKYFEKGTVLSLFPIAEATADLAAAKKSLADVRGKYTEAQTTIDNHKTKKAAIEQQIKEVTEGKENAEALLAKAADSKTAEKDKLDPASKTKATETIQTLESNLQKLAQDKADAEKNFNEATTGREGLARGIQEGWETVFFKEFQVAALKLVARGINEAEAEANKDESQKKKVEQGVIAYVWLNGALKGLEKSLTQAGTEELGKELPGEADADGQNAAIKKAAVELQTVELGHAFLYAQNLIDSLMNSNRVINKSQSHWENNLKHYYNGKTDEDSQVDWIQKHLKDELPPTVTAGAGTTPSGVANPETPLVFKDLWYELDPKLAVTTEREIEERLQAKKTFKDLAAAASEYAFRSFDEPEPRMQGRILLSHLSVAAFDEEAVYNKEEELTKDTYFSSTVLNEKTVQAFEMVVYKVFFGIGGQAVAKLRNDLWVTEMGGDWQHFSRYFARVEEARRKHERALVMSDRKENSEEDLKNLAFRSPTESSDADDNDDLTDKDKLKAFWANAETEIKGASTEICGEWEAVSEKVKD